MLQADSVNDFIRDYQHMFHQIVQAPKFVHLFEYYNDRFDRYKLAFCFHYYI